MREASAMGLLLLDYPIGVEGREGFASTSGALQKGIP